MSNGYYIDDETGKMCYEYDDDDLMFTEKMMITFSNNMPKDAKPETAYKVWKHLLAGGCQLDVTDYFDDEYERHIWLEDDYLETDMVELEYLVTQINQEFMRFYQDWLMEHHAYLEKVKKDAREKAKAKCSS